MLELNNIVRLIVINLRRRPPVFQNVLNNDVFLPILFFKMLELQLWNLCEVRHPRMEKNVYIEAGDPRLVTLVSRDVI